MTTKTQELINKTFDILTDSFKKHELINKNFDILTDFFRELASGSIFNGNCHRLYLDIENGEIFYTEEPSENTYIADDSIFEICRAQGYADTEINNEIFSMTVPELYSYGFSDWLDDVERSLKFILVTNGIKNEN
jgi:hypothetical protein